MSELLHAGSLAATGFGACCVALDGPRPRVRQIALSIVMLLAMIDVVTGAEVVPVVWWSCVIVVVAMALAVRRRGGLEPVGVSRMRVLDGVGAVLMASLMLVMSVPTSSAGESHHGASAAQLGLILSVGAIAYAGATAVAVVRHRHGLERLQMGSMAGSVLLLTLAGWA